MKADRLTRRWLPISAVALGVIGFALWPGDPEVPSKPPAPSAASAEAAPPATGSDPGPSCTFPEGARLLYRWATELTTIAQNPLTDSGAPMRGQAELSGSLALTSRGPADDGWLLEGHIALAPGAADALVSAEVQADLTAPFGLEVGHDCGMRRIGFPEAWLPASRGTLHALLTPFDVGYALGQGGATWARTHADGRGRLLVSYARADGAPGSFQRRRVHYTSLWPEPRKRAAEVTVEAQESRVSMHADGGWIDTLEERVRYAVHRKGRLVVTEKMRFEIARTGSEGVAAPPAAARLEWMSLEEAPPSRDPASVDAALPKALEGESLEAMTERLMAALGDREAKRAAHALLVAYLKRFPERAAELEAFIRGYDGASGDLATLFRALRKTGTPEAQSALVRLMAEGDVLDRVRGAAALGGLDAPTPETLDALERMSSSLAARLGQQDQMTATSATAALGRILSEVGPGDEALAAHLEATLKRRLGAEPATTEAVALIRAVGNSGSENLLPTLLEQLQSADASIRREAARAFRRMDPDLTAAHFAGLFAGEVDPNVRLELILAAMEGARLAGIEPPAGVVSHVVTQLPNEANDTVRQALVKLLGAAAEVNPAARSALIAQFQVEKTPAILQLIGRYIPASELP